MTADEFELNDPEDRRLTREDLVRTGAAGALALGLGGALPRLAKAAAPKRGGHLRVGLGGGFGAKATLDPNFFTGAQPDQAGLISLFDRLVVRDHNFKIKMALAEEIESNRTATEWTIRVRPGVRLHNGRVLGADDLVASFRRKLLKATTTKSNFGFIDPSRIRKLDRRTIRIGLNQPYAPFLEPLSRYLGFLTPAGFDPKKPIGSGPFRFVSFSPGQRTELEAFDEYWGVGPYVEHLTIAEINDDTARVNALLSGQLEAINNVPADQLPALRRGSAVRQLVSPTGAIRALAMNTTAPPFDDVRVRQAMRLIVDRDQMVKLALAGQGRVGNDLFGPLDPCYNTGLPQRHQDIERAKFLLQQAGKADLTIQLSTSDVAPGLLAASQIFAQQAKQAGVTVELHQVPASTYFSVAWLKDPFFVTYGSSSAYLEYAAIATLSNAPLNETTFHDTSYDALYKRATAAVDDRQRCGIIGEMMKVDYDRGGYIIWTYPNFTDAYNKKVTGFVPAKAWMPLTNFEFNRVSFV